MVAITGQVPTFMIGNDSFQEADIYGITIPVTKYNYLVKKAEDLPRIFKEAFHVASSGRPGPVLIDVPKDIQAASVKAKPAGAALLPGYTPVDNGHPRQIEAVLAAVESARRPVIYAGGGLINAGAASELREFVRKTRIPVTTTLMGKGAFPDDHELHLGMPGMHGTKPANLAIYEADLVIALGVRFDDRVAGDVRRFSPLARIVHVDIDAAEIGKRMGVHVPVVGSLKNVLASLNEKAVETARRPWLERIAAWKEKYPLTYDENCLKIKPQQVIKSLSDRTRGEIIVTTDVGQHQMWAAQYYNTTQPRRFLTSGGLGTMGYGFPAAIGAQVGCPDRTVVALTGDGSFQMCLKELATARMYDLPVKIFIFNNGCLGMVRQWQEFFCEGRYSSTVFDFNPDFCRVAEGYGLTAFRVDDPQKVDQAIDQALSTSGPVLVDFVIDPRENVMPMIPAGGGQTDFYEESK